MEDFPKELVTQEVLVVEVVLQLLQVDQRVLQVKEVLVDQEVLLMLVVVPSMLAVVAMFIEIHSGSVIPLLRIIGLMIPMQLWIIISEVAPFGLITV